MAPLTFGAISLALPISGTFFVFAGVAVAGAVVARGVAGRQKALESSEATTTATDGVDGVATPTTDGVDSKDSG
jgi:hypothetical protein